MGVGVQALFNDTVGNQNAAVGYQTLFTNVDGDKSTGIGSQALFNNTSGSDNVGVGFRTLFTNTMGSRNTGMGYRTLLFNELGTDNTAIGWNALFNKRSSASLNTAVGSQALLHNTTGNVNTAVGFAALLTNSTGQENTAVGPDALEVNTTGGFNTAIGARALHNNTTGGGNTALGLLAGANVTTAQNVLCLGSSGGNVDNTAWIENVFGVTTQGGATAPVVVSISGQLGTVASSERFKKDIATMNKTSEAILSLRPVTFHYKTDTDGTPQFGLIAEEVAKVNPALVLPDKEGKPYSVRYDAVNAMLLNEFLKEHLKVEEQEATITQLKTELRATATRQQKQIDALTAGLQKVSAQLATASPSLADLK